MNTSQTLHDAVVVAPPVRPEDIIDAHYDADTREIVVSFQDGKIARVLTTEFEELAAATATDYEHLDGTRSGVTCITDTVDFAVAASWWRKQAV
ncbi:hypothetical protein U2F10_33430 [Leptothoe sp. EHU-05/26/07-4]|uniref:DUF2442 domain-containing protein n=1 Tax=Adonisia turfae CCMR0081 TaxID=2292702 RepID=A0A6M0RG26_9CYAN|nr:hypothetical protein [Adonisia turfae]NEZ54803.1 hypothetical protein [Adonisia turfae CCMR0081]